jgi:putative ABC transport system substrate-binding protein
MRRRAFALGGVGALLAVPLGGLAQTHEPPLVGFLGLASEPLHVLDVRAFREGLAQLGYVEGKTIVVDDRYADGRVEQFDALLDAVMSRGARVTVVPGLAAALAVRERAPEMPVVAVGLPSTVIYPDLFSSLHRPGGSVTGFSHFGEDLAVKRVELLREVMPSLTTVAILHNSVDPLYRAWGEKTEHAALEQGLKTIRLELERRSSEDLVGLMQVARDAGAQALLVVRDFLTHTMMNEVVQAADDMRIGIMAEQRKYVDAGALMSYGASFPELYRGAAGYVDEILKGASPAEMPIQLASEFELVVNQRVAQQLGLTIPPSILLRAEEVIE